MILACSSPCSLVKASCSLTPIPCRSRHGVPQQMRRLAEEDDDDIEPPRRTTDAAGSQVDATAKRESSRPPETIREVPEPRPQDEFGSASAVAAEGSEGARRKGGSALTKEERDEIRRERERARREAAATAQ